MSRMGIVKYINNLIFRIISYSANFAEASVDFVRGSATQDNSEDSSSPDSAAYSCSADCSAFDFASTPVAEKAFADCFVLSYFAVRADSAATFEKDIRDSFPDKGAFADRVGSSSADCRYSPDSQNYSHKAYSSAAYLAVPEAEGSPASADRD